MPPITSIGAKLASRHCERNLVVLQVAVAHAVGRAANPVNSVAPLQPMPVEPNPTPGVQEAVV
jgi:hypothetical protein